MRDFSGRVLTTIEKGDSVKKKHFTISDIEKLLDSLPFGTLIIHRREGKSIRVEKTESITAEDLTETA